MALEREIGTRQDGPAPVATTTATSPAVASESSTVTQWEAPSSSDRPGKVTVAAAFLVVLGVLVTLVGLTSFAFGSLFDDAGGNFDPGMASAIQGAASAVGVLALLFGVLHLVGGLGSIARRNWGRFLGILVAGFGLLLWIVILVGSLTAPAAADQPGSPGFTFLALLLTVGYGFTIAALASAGRYFDRHPAETTAATTAATTTVTR
ncbi:MAG: hypothetical protein H0X16_03310 [Chloroflexi bacterium]|nr:hypothetical protein [Chloroflexota bacterium]